MVLGLIVLASTVGWMGYVAQAIPAPSVNCIIEPGAGCGPSQSSWTLYKDGSNVLAGKGTGGGNSFSETSLNAAVADVIGSNERITVRAAVYSLTNFITLTGNNITLDLEPGVEIDIPNNAGWTATINAGHTGSEIPAIVVQTADTVRITGGFYRNLFVASNAVSGILIGFGNNVFVDHVTMENMGIWGVIINGFSNDVTGGYSNIHVSEFTCINNGNNSDGGCVKVQNSSNPTLNVGRVWIQNGFVKTTVFYGFDIGATQATGISILDNEVTGNNAAAAIFIEAFSNNFVKIDGNRVTGGQNGIKVLTPATNIGIINNLVESAQRDGVQLTNGGTSGGQWLISGNIVRNNGQSGVGYAGINVAELTGNAGAMGNITLVGNISTDTQGSKTQSYGVQVFTNVANTFNYLTIQSNNLCGNISNGVKLTISTGTLKNGNFQNNACYNPINRLGNFVSGTTIAPWGTTTTLVTATDYVVDGGNMCFTSSAGTGITIIIKDGAANVIYTPGATVTVPICVPYGWIVHIDLATQPTFNVIYA